MLQSLPVSRVQQAHLYRMERNSLGDLQSVTTPGGDWLHFENDAEHRIGRIEASTGRTVTYKYDAKGCLSRVSDSDGHVEVYTYDDSANAKHCSRADAPILMNR
jgi:YD repeat-containing protein